MMERQSLYGVKSLAANESPLFGDSAKEAI